MTVEPAIHGVETGTIYVLRSHSKHPYFAQHRDLIHKIGVTGGEVSARVSNAKADPTFLFAARPPRRCHVAGPGTIHAV
jgi:hypothetical protein